MRGDSSILDTLETVEWGVRNFGSLHTNRVCKLRDVRRCETRGYVRCIGPVTVCDGDGFHVEPERYRNGWVLTAKGQTWLDRNRVP